MKYRFIASPYLIAFVFIAPATFLFPLILFCIIGSLWYDLLIVLLVYVLVSGFIALFYHNAF